jgi:serine/threonine protein phosphatase PrpC
MALDVDIGWHSVRGARESNEDFAAALRAQPHEAGRGLVAAIADGVSAGGRGREAAQTTVMSLLQDYFGTPATWDTSVALDRVISAQNAWLAGANRRASAGTGAMTTLTALVLRGHSYTLAHVGDTRAWLLRDGACTQLTQDHVFDHPDLRSRLSRAIGLDDAVRVDYSQGELQRGDVFVLTSDGVHGAVGARQLCAQLAKATAQAASEAIVQGALQAGSRDNASALVIHVRELADARLEDVLLDGRQLPVPPRLKVGDTLDQYTVTVLVADTGAHRLYQARDNASRELVAIKTLHEARAGDAEERAMLAHEVWLGLRLAEQGGKSAGFVGVREPRAPSAFYAVFDWHGGSTLEQQLARKQAFGVEQVVPAAIAVARALGKLHRQGVVHRDIKPANLHLGDDGRWRVLDLGVAVSGFESADERALHAGTPSYMNPEQWEDGGQADAGSDLYALGATLYQWLTGHLPYGQIEPWQRARFRHDPKPPSRLRPDVPIWLDHVLLRAVARDARLRFETAEEFVLALERGASRPVAAPGATPLFQRDPTAVWKALLVASAALNGLLLFWLLFLPR